jgi:hypothetical protein
MSRKTKNRSINGFLEVGLKVTFPNMEVVVPTRHHHPSKDSPPFIKGSDTPPRPRAFLEPVVILVLRVKSPNRIPEALARPVYENHWDPSVYTKLRGRDEGRRLLQCLDH